ncbi:hypothetical protein CANTEDRAFT_95811 [Yamadazyma tenuis ATCC 10573]|uniref:Abscisic acid G-protein coupled receptor-like domain-containing protein n=2 Tax=Candida tenuis TaxID=2315449 RepID=G3BDR1_CANTC|nr:uncharacterized protein CANTEDRAFT_95811 [Yamadazyma tenuis ATCC 10573]EGV60357.1 hypothetical protein CANTEDRAFT_95811 [Yamadazyma tenuis ATCC 10573]
MSVELIFLVLCELAGFEVIPWLFQTLVDTLVLLVALVMPFMVLGLVVAHRLTPIEASHMGKLAFCVGYVGWFLMLSRLGSLARDFRHAATDWSVRSLLDTKITQVGLMGITTNSVLSGIGSSTVIYKVISAWKFKSSRGVSEKDINGVISNYNNINVLLEKRNSELNGYLVKTGGTVYNTPDPLNNSLKKKGNKLGGIMHRVQSFASLQGLPDKNSDEYEISELNKEIRSLKNMRNDTYNQLTRLLYAYEADNQPKHITTTVADLSNCGFAIYCLYRLINIVVLRLPYYYWSNATDDESKDALAITISKIILAASSSTSSVTEKQLVTLISFSLSGSLFLLTFSNVLMTLRSFSRFFPIITSLPKQIKSWSVSLIVCQLFGIYVISTCLLIRTNLPSNLSFQISRILSLSGSNVESEAMLNREIKFIDTLFDLIFLISNIITFVVFYLRKLADSDESLDEEEMIEGAKDFKSM